MTPNASGTRLTNRYSLALLGVLGVGLTASLWLRHRWLWQDEVISYVYLTTPSLGALHRALAGSLDANPPLFLDVYWLLGHVSLHPQFLRAVSVGLFALTIALFYRYTTQRLGRPTTNFMVLTLFICATNLDYRLAIQVRGYSLFLLLNWLFFVSTHRLALAPGRRGQLLVHGLLATALAFVHNYGLFYVATAGAFFLVLAGWTRRWEYLWALGAQAVAGGLWLVGWFPTFQVQSQSGKPYSWIPAPTIDLFFRTVCELLPLHFDVFEANPYFRWLPMVRVAGLAWLLVVVGRPLLRRGPAALLQQPAHLMVVLAGFVAVGSTAVALAVSVAVVPVFISRYLWFNHLLFALIALQAYYRFARPGVGAAWRPLMPAYVVLLVVVVAYRSSRTMLFSADIIGSTKALNPRYPLFFESVDYFLPIWHQRLHPQPRFLLDWPGALRSTSHNAVSDYHEMETLRANFGVPQVVAPAEFTGTRFPRFYVVDEPGRYQIEGFVAAGRVRVLRVLPTSVADQHILECVFADPAAADGVPVAASSGVGPGAVGR